MRLVPQPQSLTPKAGNLPAPSREFSLNASALGLRDSLPTLGFASKDSVGSGEQAQPNSIEVSPSFPKNGYWLSINSLGIRIKAFDEAAAFHALATLRQIFLQHPTHLPCLEIEDWPDLQTRGFMLDISRCRVPTQASLYDLADLLASLKYNQLQLYTEHTFAYRDHEPVWRYASPLTSEEIQDLDAYCRTRYIELVPNQNSFGHMERWLRHPAYRHLAECPNGFEHPISGWKEHGSTLRPTQDSADFVDSLYEELLPHFSSRNFNIGGDEPWELGKGFSKPLVAARGKSRVYLEHLLRIQNKVRARGFRMQFWGDIIIEQPELAAELESDVTALLWGYEADHPFQDQCQAIREAGRPFTVVPGTSTWNSIGGRLHTALPNIEAAASAAKRFQAQGLLLTEWGDNGHHQSHLPRLVPIMHAAALSWSRLPDNSDLTQAATRLLPNPVSTSQYQTILEFSEIAAGFPTYLHNQSWLNKILFATPDTFASLSETLERDELQAAQARLEAFISTGELELARQLLLHSTGKGFCLLDRKTPPNLPPELIESYRHHWLEHSRVGGLEESTAYLQPARR